MTLAGVFIRDGAAFDATELARGPWDPRALHGGAPAALLVHVFERCIPGPELRLARVTYEFVRPVPLGKLSVTTALTRPGRRVSLLEGAIHDADGNEVTRARALLVRASEVGDKHEEPPPFPGPEQGRSNDFNNTGLTMFATDAMDIRFVAGAFSERGPATAWFRLRQPVVAGEPPSPLERVAAASDFGNGIASELSWREHLFINPDLTVYFEREPRGEWVALQSQMRVTPGSVATAESVLWDEQGRIGRATQALVVERRPAT
jgi:Thioesterase-like superfamily